VSLTHSRIIGKARPQHGLSDRKIGASTVLAALR